MVNDRVSHKDNGHCRYRSLISGNDVTAVTKRCYRPHAVGHKGSGVLETKPVVLIYILLLSPPSHCSLLLCVILPVLLNECQEGFSVGEGQWPLNHHVALPLEQGKEEEV